MEGAYAPIILEFGMRHNTMTLCYLIEDGYAQDTCPTCMLLLLIIMLYLDVLVPKVSIINSMASDWYDNQVWIQYGRLQFLPKHTYQLSRNASSYHCD